MQISVDRGAVTIMVLHLSLEHKWPKDLIARRLGITEGQVLDILTGERPL